MSRVSPDRGQAIILRPHPSTSASRAVCPIVISSRRQSRRARAQVVVRGGRTVPLGRLVSCGWSCTRPAAIRRSDICRTHSSCTPVAVFKHRRIRSRAGRRPYAAEKSGTGEDRRDLSTSRHGQAQRQSSAPRAPTRTFPIDDVHRDSFCMIPIAISFFHLTVCYPSISISSSLSIIFRGIPNIVAG